MPRFGIVAAGGILSAALWAAASPTPAPTPAGPDARSRKTPAEMESVTGTVKKFRPGKSIVIVGLDGKGRKLELDGTTRIDGPVKRGEAVTAVWMTDAAGRRHVHAISTHPPTNAEEYAASASPGIAAARTAPSPEPTPRETAAAPTATPHARSDDAAATPGARRTPLPNAP